MESQGQRQSHNGSVTHSGLRPARTSTFPMQRLLPGLKALISSESELQEERPLRCLTRTNTFPSLFSSSSSSQMGENGYDSGDHQEKVKEEKIEEEKEVYMSRRQKWRNEWRNRVLPPPLPVMVKRELPPSLPWVLKKYITGSDEDGGKRVVMIEERVKHHEYFRAHRANGHLTLQLICVDEDDDEDETRGLETDNDVEQEYCATETETEDAEDVEVVDEEETHENGDTDRTVEEVPVMALSSSMPELSLGSKSNGGGGAGIKCWMVSSSVGRRSDSELFRMPIPTIRPIHG